jgi:hypothetical protein
VGRTGTRNRCRPIGSDEGEMAAPMTLRPAPQTRVIGGQRTRLVRPRSLQPAACQCLQSPGLGPAVDPRRKLLPSRTPRPYSSGSSRCRARGSCAAGRRRGSGGRGLERDRAGDDSARAREDSEQGERGDALCHVDGVDRRSAVENSTPRPRGRSSLWRRKANYPCPQAAPLEGARVELSRERLPG